MSLKRTDGSYPTGRNPYLFLALLSDSGKASTSGAGSVVKALRKNDAVATVIQSLVLGAPIRLEHATEREA